MTAASAGSLSAVPVPALGLLVSIPLGGILYLAFGRSTASHA